MKRAGKGFTLIEILVVIVIMGILLGIAAIFARDWLLRYQVEGQTKQIYADLMNARVRALQQNRIFFVTLGAYQYAVYEDTYPPPDGNGQPDTGPGQDQLVMQKTTQYALSSSPSTTIFSYTAEGLASLSTPTAVDIQCQSTTNPASDCVEVSLTRTLMGKWNGSTCVAQ